MKDVHLPARRLAASNLRREIGRLLVALDERALNFVLMRRLLRDRAERR